MALRQSPNIVTNGLVFYTDMNNRAKSWIGAPATNLVAAANTNDLNSGYAKSSATPTTTTSNEILMPAQVLKYSGSKTLADTVYNASGWIAHTGTGGISSGQQITCSWYVKGISALSVIWTWGGAHTGNASSYTVDLKTGSVSSVSMVGSETYSVENAGDGWWRLSCSTTMTGTSCYPQLSYSGVLAVCGTQFELGNRASTYLIGTRSTTQAVIDLVGRNTITVNNLTYLSDGNFKFTNASNNYMTVAGSGFVSGMTGYTIAHWSRRDIESKMPVAGASTTAFYQYGDNSWKYQHGGVDAEYYYPKAVSIPLGTWGFYCIVYDGSYVKIYRNGVFEGQQATTGAADWSQGLKIGGWTSSASYAYDGYIGAVQFYNRGLTAGEVQQNFNALRSRYGI